MEPLMDKAALAAYLRLPVNTVTDMITARRCPRVTKVGRHIRFDPADVRAWVEQQKEGGTGLRLAPGPSWPPTTNPPPAGPNTPPPPAGPKFPRERAA